MTNYKLTVTAKADTDEDEIYKYPRKEFGEIYANRFRQKLIQFFNLLLKKSLIGRPAKNKSTLRVYIFSRQNKVVYKLEEYNIIIIRILNTKTNLAYKF